VFVLGTGRCGSTLVHELLARGESMAFVSNIDDRLGRLGPWTAANPALLRTLPAGATEKGRVRFAPSEGYRLLARRVSPMLVDPCRDLTAADAHPWLVQRLRTTADEVCGRQQRPVFLHKLTGWPRAGLLTAAFDDVRFVHVVRDGRAVVASWLRMPWWRGHLGPSGWHFGPLGAHDQRLWEEADRSFAVLAGIGWRLLMDAAADAAAQVPASRWIEVRYEDLVADPTAFVDRLALDLGIHDQTELRRAARRLDLRPARVDAWRGDLTPEDRRRLDDLLGAELTARGYLAAP
jgi:LPS sulfotransferase NodH